VLSATPAPVGWRLGLAACFLAPRFGMARRVSAPVLPKPHPGSGPWAFQIGHGEMQGSGRENYPPRTNQ
jgi:hypothetical protein